jgi:hypothetical protein
MPFEDVLDTEATETPVVPKGQPETITISKADYARLERERDEAKASEKYWADRARPAATVQPEEEEDPIETSDLVPKVTGAAGVDESIFSDPDKWLQAISKGPDAIKSLIKSQGYVNADQVAEIAAKVARRTVDVERGKIGTDNKLMSAFPELADNKSELFRATAEEYNELIAFDPAAKKSPATLFAAARAAKAKLAARAPQKPVDEEDEYGYDRVESDRRSRVAAQDGSRGGRGSRVEEPEDGLGPQAKSIARMMGISEDEMKAEKKKTDAVRRRR